MDITDTTDMATEKPIRCFIAIEIPKAVQNLLCPAQTDLQSQIRKASWTKPGNFHLTLKFLGDVQPDAVDKVGTALAAVAEKHSPFSIELGGIGGFPTLARPRVIWVGIKQRESTLTQLAHAVNRELTLLDFPMEKRFHAHLTLGRLRSPKNLEPLTHILRKYDTIHGSSMQVNALVLMRSDLHRNGAVYTPLSFCRFSTR